MEQIKALLNRVDALSIRERGIILAGVIFIMYTVWDIFLMQPQAIQERQTLARLQTRQAEQTALNIKFQNLLMQGREDTAGADRQRLAALKNQLETVEEDVRQSTRHLVTPANMAGILQSILQRSQGLVLTEIKGLGAIPLLSQTPQSVQDQSAATAESTAQVPAGTLEGAWKHGLVIRFEGDYMSTLAYMRELESLEWEFFWDSIEFEVIEYPRGKASMTLYTLSLEKDWIGV